MEQSLKDAMRSAVESIRSGLPVSHEAQVELCMNYHDLAQLPISQRKFILDALRGRGNDEVKGDWAKQRYSNSTRRIPAGYLFLDTVVKLSFIDPLSGLTIEVVRYRDSFEARLRDCCSVSNTVKERFDEFDKLRNPDRVDAELPMVRSCEGRYSLAFLKGSLHSRPENREYRVVSTYHTFGEAVAVGLELARLVSEDGQVK